MILFVDIERKMFVFEFYMFLLNGDNIIHVRAGA